MSQPVSSKTETLSALRKSVFVSSTFRDMQKERDILHNRVVPELNEFARKYGGSIQFTDLRWGISTTNLESNEGAKKVLKVCLDEINHCRPYMIVLLGDRYGWTPEVSLITNASKEMRYNPDINAENPISVTELEIRFGALDNPDQLDRCLFYFREPLPEERMSAEQKKTYAADNDADKRRMANLKDAIRRKGGRVFEYHADWDETTGVTGLEEFAAKVTDDIRQLLLNDWGEAPKELTWQDRERISDRVFIAEKCSHFVGRAAGVSDCKQFVEKGDKKLLIIKGESGSGKSSLMCHLAQEFDDGIHTPISVFCGNSTYAASAWHVLQSLVYRFENLLGITEHFGADEGKRNQSLDAEGNKSLSLQDWRDKLAELIGSYIHTTQKHPVILIDALDQLLQDDMAKDLEFLPDSIQDGASVIISCLSDYNIALHSPLLKHSEEWPLPEFTPDDMRAAIDGILKANGKELDERVIDILTAIAKNQTILYISFALQRLMMFDEDDFAHIYQLENSGVKPDDAICQYMIEVLDKLPDNLEDMCVALINEAGERINPALADTATDLLAVSRYGLRVADLEAVFAAHGLEWNTIDFTLLKRYLSSNFMELEDGRINFTHKSIREGLKNETPNRGKYEQWIFEHLKGLDANDAVKASEMVHHAYAANQQEFLIGYFGSVDESENEGLKEKTASAVRDECLEGATDWFAELAKTAGKFGEDACIRYLIFYVNQRFAKSMKELPVNLKIMTGVKEGLESIPENEITPDQLRLLSVSLDRVGSNLECQGRYDEAFFHYKHSLAVCNDLVDEFGTLGDKRDLKVSLERIGFILETQGRYDEAFSYYERSLSTTKQLVDEFGDPRDIQEFVVSLSNVGNILHSQGKYEEALSYHEHALTIDKQRADELRTSDAKQGLAMSLSNVGITLESMNKHDKALSYYERSLSIDKQLVDELGTPEVKRGLLMSLSNVGEILYIQGKSAEALSYYERSLSIAEQLVDELGTPRVKRDLSVILNKLGSILRIQGKSAEALSHHERSLAIDEYLLDEFGTLEDKQNLSVSLNNIGITLEVLGEHAKSFSYYERSLAIGKQLAEELGTQGKRRNLAMNLSNMGFSLVAQGKYAESLLYYESSLAIFEQLTKELGTPEAKQDLTIILNTIGDILQIQGKSAEAFSYYERALSIFEPFAVELGTPEAKQGLSLILGKVGDILQSQGKSTEALFYYERSMAIVEQLAEELGQPPV